MTATDSDCLPNMSSKFHCASVSKASFIMLPLFHNLHWTGLCFWHDVRQAAFCLSLICTYEINMEEEYRATQSIIFTPFFTTGHYATYAYLENLYIWQVQQCFSKLFKQPRCSWCVWTPQVEWCDRSQSCGCCSWKKCLEICCGCILQNCQFRYWRNLWGFFVKLLRRLTPVQVHEYVTLSARCK